MQVRNQRCRSYYYKPSDDVPNRKVSTKKNHVKSKSANDYHRLDQDEDCEVDTIVIASPLAVFVKQGQQRQSHVGCALMPGKLDRTAHEADG